MINCFIGDILSSNCFFFNVHGKKDDWVYGKKTSSEEFFDRFDQHKTIKYCSIGDILSSNWSFFNVQGKRTTEFMAKNCSEEFFDRFDPHKMVFDHQNTDSFETFWVKICPLSMCKETRLKVNSVLEREQKNYPNFAKLLQFCHVFVNLIQFLTESKITIIAFIYFYQIYIQ